MHMQDTLGRVRFFSLSLLLQGPSKQLSEALQAGPRNGGRQNIIIVRDWKPASGDDRHSIM